MVLNGTACKLLPVLAHEPCGVPCKSPTSDTSATYFGLASSTGTITHLAGCSTNGTVLCSSGQAVHASAVYDLSSMSWSTHAAWRCPEEERWALTLTDGGPTGGTEMKAFTCSRTAIFVAAAWQVRRQLPLQCRQPGTPESAFASVCQRRLRTSEDASHIIEFACQRLSMDCRSCSP
jgi:hypothetical protein